MAMASPNLERTIEKFRPIVKAQHINRKAFEQAFQFLKNNPSEFENKNYLTIIDYDLPSTKKRFYIFDLRRLKITSLYVAHGKRSGLKEAESFSNKIDSKKTTLGFLKTGTPYNSHEVGPALLLHGLEDKNKYAFERRIVIHGAKYVGPKFLKRHGYLGRSLGCPAVETRWAKSVIAKLKGGSLIYSYHSDFPSNPKSRPRVG
jgi:hypothetical protein